MTATRSATPDGRGVAELPEWDLSDLYPSPDDASLQDDLARAAAEAEGFEADLKSRLPLLDAGALAAAIERYQAIDERLGRLGSYAGLVFAADSTDPERGRFAQGVNERVTAIGTHLLFFTLELNELPDHHLERLGADASLRAWQPFLRDVRVFRPHQLPAETERVLLERDLTGRAAFSRLFDETIAALRVPLGGEQLTLGAALNTLSDPDRDRRAAAARAVGTVLADNSRLFSLITNTLSKDKQVTDGWRGYPRPGSSRNRANMVEDEVVAALVAAVSADYGRISHRYYALKASWLGLPRLQHWDRNAPLPGDDDRHVSWSEASRRVLAAYDAFDPELGRLGRRFFDGNWIDAAPRPGKSGGAFAHPTVPSVHPYILLNYRGRTRDVMTLAHELGHGVHQILAGRHGHLMAATPLTLAETASVFGEMLAFRATLDGETDPTRRRILLAGKVEDMLNTVVRQISFYQFETRLHDRRREGELLPDDIAAIWLDVQRDSLGPAFEFTPDYGHYWSYVPHFVHSPFYVYAYAFGDCLVNALYGVFAAGHPGFQAKYLDLLRAGGTRRHRELLAPFGLDATQPDFWKRGLDVISGFIDELEAATPSATASDHG